MKYLLLAYILIGIFTFGHAASHCKDCKTPLDRAVLVYVGGIFWPLYWSWEIQERMGR